MTATPIAELVAAMLDRDASRDEIVMAVTAAERHAASRDASRDLRDAKAKSAARSKRYRQRKKRDASRDAKTAYIDTSSPPEQNSKKEGKKTHAAKTPLVTLPDDWQPDREFAKAQGWSDQHIDTEAQRFRDSAIAKGRKYAAERGWAAAWRNWVTSPFQQPKTASGINGHAPRPGSREDTRERTVNALRNLKAFAESDEPPRGREDDPAISGLLPFAKPA